MSHRREAFPVNEHLLKGILFSFHRFGKSIPALIVTNGFSPSACLVSHQHPVLTGKRRGAG